MLSRTQGMNQFWRKYYVFGRNLTIRKLANAGLRLAAFVTHNPGLGGVPLHIKVDVSPNCQLRCPICLHSSMTHAERASLPKAMVPETFATLVDQVRGRTLAMSLYNLGEPLLNKSLTAMIRYAADAKINTYITSNFSMPLSDAQLTALAQSGLSLLVVAVDGISAETFGVQRIRGNLPVIEDNMRRFIAIRGKNGPRVTLQYLTFDHNRHETPKVQAYCDAFGIDDAWIINGTDGTKKPWLVQFAQRQEWLPKTWRPLPRCGWPFFSALVGTAGEVYGCCHYRMDENYLRRDESRPLGNIHQASMEEIYDSQAYREARQLSSNPGRHGPKPHHFCHGCKVIQS